MIPKHFVVFNILYIVNDQHLPFHVITLCKYRTLGRDVINVTFVTQVKILEKIKEILIGINLLMNEMFEKNMKKFVGEVITFYGIKKKKNTHERQM